MLLEASAFRPAPDLGCRPKGRRYVSDLISILGVSVAYNDLHEFVKRLKEAGELKRIPVGSGCGSGDYGNYRPRIEGWRAGTAFREATLGE